MKIHPAGGLTDSLVMSDVWKFLFFVREGREETRGSCQGNANETRINNKIKRKKTCKCERNV